MILVLVLAGFMAGTAAAFTALIGGTGLGMALVAYAAFGALAVFLSSALAAAGPGLRHALALRRERHPLPGHLPRLERTAPLPRRQRAFGHGR